MAKKKRASDRTKPHSITFSKGAVHVAELMQLAGSTRRARVVDHAVLLAVRLFKEGRLERREDFHLGDIGPTTKD